jgi:hypothetical protein
MQRCTELVQLGREGVDGALACSAQAIPRPAANYLGKAVAEAKLKTGQAMKLPVSCLRKSSTDHL